MGMGSNGYGQLGIPSNTYYVSSPVVVFSGSSWSKISAGKSHVLAIKSSDSSLWHGDQIQADNLVMVLL
jgi:hypothetical protein